MPIEPKTYKEQRPSSILDQVEIAFEDVWLIFGLFNTNPVEILTLLTGDLSDRALLRENLDKREYFSSNPAFGESKVILKSFKRSSGQAYNLIDWVNTRYSSLTTMYTQYEREMALAEPTVRTYWIKQFEKLISRLSSQLRTFEGKKWNDVSEVISDSTVDWKDFYETLQRYPDFFKWHLMQYGSVCDGYTTPLSSMPVPASGEMKPNKDGLESLQNQSSQNISKLIVTSTLSASNNPNPYETFADLFINPKDLAICVEALRRIMSPVINSAGTWIGRKGSKSVLVAWIERLEECNKIHRISARRELVHLLNNHFPDLCMGVDARIFGHSTKAYDTYKAEFAALILP